jgi:hypothetical protein
MSGRGQSGADGLGRGGLALPAGGAASQRRVSMRNGRAPCCSTSGRDRDVAQHQRMGGASAGGGHRRAPSYCAGKMWPQAVDTG